TILDNMGMDGAQLVSRGGLRIITTLDMDLYEQTECTLQTHLARLRGQPVAQPQTRRGSQCLGAVFLPETPPAPQLIPPDDGAVVIIDARTGELLTMNGTGVQPIYQPGPVLYPFVYLHGFINPDPFYTAASMLLDIPRPFAGRAEGSILIPTNPNDTYYGPLSLRDAMGSGLVPPAMEVANTLNINAVIRQTANRMGINTLREGDFGLDLLERGGAISLLDVAYTYAVFAGMGETSGIRVEPVAPGLRDHDAVAIRRIEDTAGNILWQYDDDQKALSRVLVLQEQLAYVVNDILSDQRTRWRTLGQGNILEMPRQPAVVNGITADQVDNWTVGYTPQMVVAVQLDRADRGATSLDGFALDGAATVWRALMEYVHGRDSLPIAAWDTPEAIVATPVCEISGLSPTDACETRNEIFLDPAQFPPRDTYWELVEINTQTGERASRTTPAALRSMAAYFIPPEEAMDWWRANGRPLPPVAVDTASRGDLLSSVVILQPGNYDTVGGVVDIRGAMDDTDLAFWQLTYGEGANPQEWIPLTEPQETFVPGTSLALWDTSGLDGTYVLQLQMVRSDNTVEDGFVQVVVDNRPPSVVLTAGEPGQTFNWPSDQTIPLVAEVADNIRVSRVDFYHNGQFITSDDSFPFEYAHPISRTGRETFTAVVYDAVENSSEATLEVEVVRQDG
ncbi:MAG: Ig-like domain-containing protein, partial [Chloroflexota bacterium]